MSSRVHIPVLLQEVVSKLDIQDGDVVFDATVGGTGYSKVFASATKNITLIGLDRDADAIESATETFKEMDTACDYTFLVEDFRNLDSVLERLGHSHVDKVAFDLGLSSDQLESSGRGFSFKRDEPLIMTFATESKSKMIAYDIVNTWSESAIADVLYGYGEERYARRIARNIVRERESVPITTTDQLVRIIRASVPSSYTRRKTHPATKTFQALRIAVNDELDALKIGLEKAIELLKASGRVAVVSFHSIEDRIVKRIFKQAEERGKGVRLTKKPITPGIEEIKNNPRARSAKLRVFEKK